MLKEGRGERKTGFSGMYKEKRAGKSIEEARERAMEALKERLWKDAWKDEVELPDVRETVVEIGGMFEVEVEI